MKSTNIRLGAVAIAAVAALALGACGSSGGGTGTTAGGSSSPGTSGSQPTGTEASGGASTGTAGTDSAAPVTLDFRVGFATDSPQLKELQKLTDAYQQAHSNVKVQITSNSSNYEDDMKVRMAANNLPDLWVTHGWSLLRYSPFLEPLNTQPWAKNFNPALDAAMKNKDGQFFALPIDTDVSGIVYNETTLKDNGIDPKTLNTWDAFNAALATLKGKGIIPISSSSKDSWLAGDLIDFIASGAFDEKALDGFKNGTFDSAGYGKLMGVIETWAKDGYFNPDFASAATGDIAQNLVQGKTAFVFVQNGIMANAWTFDPNAKLGFMPVPTFDGKAFLIGGEDYAIGVGKNSKNKQAALDYLAYLAEPAQITAQASLIGSLPGLTDAKADLGKVQDSYDSWVTPDNKYPLQPYFDRVYLPNGAWDTMISTVSGVVTGQMTADAATSQMKSTYESLRAQATK